MNSADFFKKLSENQKKALIFEFEGNQINKGYHVTEFKSTSVGSVDCGGKTNNWKEMVLHITAPLNDGDDFMTVKKFLEIYTIVADKIPSHKDALMRIEFAGPEGIAVNYLVDELLENNDSLVVKSLAPGVTCKANDFITKQVPLAKPVTDLGCC